MSRNDATQVRLLPPVTDGNLRHSHFYVRGHYDFFPEEAFGPPKRNGKAGGIEIEFDGLHSKTAAAKILSGRVNRRSALS